MDVIHKIFIKLFYNILRNRNISILDNYFWHKFMKLLEYSNITALLQYFSIKVQS